MGVITPTDSRSFVHAYTFDVIAANECCFGIGTFDREMVEAVLVYAEPSPYAGTKNPLDFLSKELQTTAFRRRLRNVRWRNEAVVEYIHLMTKSVAESFPSWNRDNILDDLAEAVVLYLDPYGIFRSKHDQYLPGMSSETLSGPKYVQQAKIIVALRRGSFEDVDRLLESYDFDLASPYFGNLLDLAPRMAGEDINMAIFRQVGRKLAMERALASAWNPQIPYMAATFGHVNIFKHYLQVTNTHDEDCRLLWYESRRCELGIYAQTAARGGNLSMVAFLLEKCSCLCHYMMREAVSNGHEKVVSFLLENSATLRSTGYLLAFHQRWRYMLSYGALSGNIEVCRIILRYSMGHLGPDRYVQAMVCAVTVGAVDILKLLLEALIDGRAEESILERDHLSLEWSYHILLTTAGYYGSLGCVEVLIKEGWPLWKSPGSLILESAAAAGDTAIVQFLLENDYGHQAKVILERAYSQGRKNIIQTLTEVGFILDDPPVANPAEILKPKANFLSPKPKVFLVKTTPNSGTVRKTYHDFPEDITYGYTIQ